MKVYLDNVIVSGKVRADLEPNEMTAVEELYRLAERHCLEKVTSRETWREQDRTPDLDIRSALQDSRGDVAVVQDDHRLLGYSYLQDQYGGFIANPLVTDIVDEPLLEMLINAGLKNADPWHLMYATDRFVTLDRGFLDRRVLLEGYCPGIRIVKPTELVAQVFECQ